MDLLKKYFANCYLGLALAQCSVGLNITVGKLLIGSFPVFFLLAIRFTIGFVGMLIIAYMQKLTIKNIVKDFMLLTNKDKLLLFMQAMCGGFLFNMLILYGMKGTSAISAGIITSFTPVAIFILSALLLRDKINSRKVFSIFMVFLGLVILNFNTELFGFNKILWGDLLVLLAVIPEAFFTIFSKFLDNKLKDSVAVVLINLFNLIIFVPFALFDTKVWYFSDTSISTYAQLFIYGISGGILFFLLWYRNLLKVSADTAALFTAFMPMSTALLAVFFLNEPMHMTEVLGIFLTVSAIFMGFKTVKA